MTYQNFKPLLASEADLSKVKYPCLVSPKLDGIRALVLDGKLVSRNLKPIPNAYVRETIERYADILEGFDGEPVVGSPTAENCFNMSSSGIMSREGEPDFKFYVFDRVGEEPYHKRLASLYLHTLPDFVRTVEQIEAKN
jgi:DNA ligase-1